jgi:hypothetical protein
MGRRVLVTLCSSWSFAKSLKRRNSDAVRDTGAKLSTKYPTRPTGMTCDLDLLSEILGVKVEPSTRFIVTTVARIDVKLSRDLAQDSKSGSCFKVKVET